jgi:hypothetical protein
VIDQFSAIEILAKWKFYKNIDDNLLEPASWLIIYIFPMYILINLYLHFIRDALG